MDYTGLAAAVADDMNRTLASGDMAQFILSVESVVNARLADNPIRPQHIHSTATVSAEYAAQPTDMIDVDTISVPGMWRLDYVDPPSFNRLLADEAAYKADLEAVYTSGDLPPKYYTLIGSEFRFFPVPTGSHTLDLIYWSKVPNLNATDTANWVLTNHPTVYLHGCLAYGYKKYYDEDRAQIEAQLFSDAIDLMVSTYPHRPNNAPLRTDISARQLLA